MSRERDRRGRSRGKNTSLVEGSSAVVEQSEVLPVSEPTTLRLFPTGSITQQHVLGERANSVVQLRKEFDSSLQVRNSFVEQHFQREVRLAEYYVDTEKERLSLRSSRTIGAAYLKMHEELSQKGLSGDEIYRFFRTCLRINQESLAPDVNRQVFAENGLIKYARLIVGVPVRDVSRAAGSPHKWFEGNQQAWNRFVIDHSYFRDYLNGSELEQRTRGMSDKEKNKLFSDDINILGDVYQQGLPSWVQSDLRGDELKNVVMQELEEDTESELPLKERLSRKWQEILDLRAVRNKKSASFVAYYREKQLGLIPEIASIGDMALYMQLFEEASEVRFSPEQIRQMTYREISKHTIPSLKVHEDVLKNFFGNESTSSTSPVIALWLERKLIKANAIESSQQEIGNDEVLLLKKLLGVDEESVADTYSLQGNTTLKHAIFPLVNLMPSERKQELFDLVTTSIQSGDSSLIIEDLIWLLADEISRCIQAHDQPDEKNSAIFRTKRDMREYGKKWMRKNWQWLFQQIHRSANGHSDQLPTKEVLFEQGVESVEDGENCGSPLGEMIAETEKLKRGTLAGWKLYYTEASRMLPKDLIEIPGDSLEEREQNLAQFFGRNNISCTMQPGTVLDQLGQVLEMPEEDKLIRMRQEFGGVMYYKESVGQVRILYVMDEDNQIMTFFVHQKKAWEYRFP